MCGIAGILKLRNSSLNLQDVIQLMTQTIRHRGPDGDGFLLASEHTLSPAWGNDTPGNNKKNAFSFSPESHINEVSGDFTLALGHRRLSIIDLSAGGYQPMCCSEKNLWITYNGEIYNYRELRDELKEKGHVFYTESDTEVILAAYREWKERCLERFNGMWAFVIYNHKEQTLFGARDRFGVKPFYYYGDGSVFGFASEQKALVKSQFVKTGINPGAVFDFFATGDCEHEEEGMFKNIIELFPSHYFTLDLRNGNFHKTRYYRLPLSHTITENGNESFPNALAKTRDLLIRAVSRRLRSDVPVGACLSGGIDSSVITGIISYLMKINPDIHVGEKLKVFTASFHEKEIDESPYAKLAAEAAGAQWHQVFPNSTELFRDLEEITQSQDVPIWSTSTYAQHRVMKSAAENGIKVLLDGQGGDELFGGYYTYNFYYWMELLRKGKWSLLKKEMRSFPGASNSLSFFIRQFLRFYGMDNIPEGFKSLVYKHYFKDLNYLSTGLWNEHKHRLGGSQETSLDKKERKPRNLNEILSHEFYNQRLKVFLKCEDRCSMWHSVESRTPFSDDKDLIEYVSNLPSEYKIKNSVNKFILREAAREFLPDPIYRRTDKMGFSTPNNKWISEIKDSVYSLFDETLKDYLNVEMLKKDYHAFFSQENKPDSARIFKYISFAQWVKNFKVS